MIKYIEIPGYEGLYQVTSDGNIVSNRYNKIMKPYISNSGYYQIKLIKDGIRKHFYVHRLVMESFDGHSNLEVNHLDGNKLNNRKDNLEYLSPSDNIKHSYNIGLRNAKKGKDNVLSKSVAMFDSKGNLVKIFGSTVEAFRETGIAYQTIGQCARGYRNNVTGGGYVWKYI